MDSSSKWQVAKITKSHNQSDNEFPFETSSNLLLNKLKWEKLSLCHQKQKALFMYKTMHKLAPEYLQRFFTQRHAKCNLRNLQAKLALPKPHTILSETKFLL